MRLVRTPGRKVRGFFVPFDTSYLSSRGYGCAWVGWRLVSRSPTREMLISAQPGCSLKSLGDIAQRLA